MASKGDFIRKIEFKNQRISRDKWIFFGILFSITNEISFTNLCLVSQGITARLKQAWQKVIPDQEKPSWECWEVQEL